MDSPSAARPPELSVVLPAHNEQLLLESTVAAVSAAMVARGQSYEIVLVENGSTDQTAEIASALARTRPELRVVSLPIGNYGEALLQGIAAATAPVIATFDVDLYDFDFLDRALERIRAGGAELVIASKRAEGANDNRPIVRRLLTFGFSLVLRSLINLEVTDAHGMKVFERRSIAPVALGCQMRGSLFDVEMVVRAMAEGHTVEEVPVTVSELRPPRTGILRRSVESLRGALRLRSILSAERHDRVVPDGRRPPA